MRQWVRHTMNETQWVRHTMNETQWVRHTTKDKDRQWMRTDNG